MTPDDFPTREKYLAYVRECEESLIYADTWDNTRLTFEEATEPVETGPHWTECGDAKDPYCWCTGADGLIEYYTRGMITATHTTSPMFTFKHDHGFTEIECGVCSPEYFYWDEQGHPISREESEARFWVDLEWSRNYACVEYFDDCNLPRPVYEPDKIGPHP